MYRLCDKGEDEHYLLSDQSDLAPGGMGYRPTAPYLVAQVVADG